MRKKLKSIRKEQGYTQEYMANKLGIARTTYGGYESGKFSPSLNKAIKIKKILNYWKDDIFLNYNDSKTNKRGDTNENTYQMQSKRPDERISKN